VGGPHRAFYLAASNTMENNFPLQSDCHLNIQEIPRTFVKLKNHFRPNKPPLDLSETDKLRIQVFGF
jgi:hypothetical protein